MDALLKYGRKQQPLHYRNSFTDYSQYQFIVITSGSLQVEFHDADEAFTRCNLGQWHGVLLPPGSDFRLATPSSAYHGHFVEAPCEANQWPPYVQTFKADTQIRLAVEHLESEYRNPQTESALGVLYQLLYCRCQQVLGRLTSGSSENAEHETICSHIDALLQASCRSESHLEELLNQLPYSERHLRRVYQAQRGCSIKQAQLDIKMQEACYLLAETELSITAIAYELAYPSSQYFSALFKKHTGMTPTAYKLQAVARND